MRLATEMTLCYVPRMAKYEDKKAKLKELFAEQERIEAEIRSLLEPERIAVLPHGFSISVEVMRLIGAAGVAGVSSQEILRMLQKEFPSYGIDREKVASALAYAKNEKHAIEQVARGVYRLVENK